MIIYERNNRERPGSGIPFGLDKFIIIQLTADEYAAREYYTLYDVNNNLDCIFHRKRKKKFCL